MWRSDSSFKRADLSANLSNLFFNNVSKMKKPCFKAGFFYLREGFYTLYIISSDKNLEDTYAP